MLRYHHHHHVRGNFKGKLILAGVTLWLTSTVIAGVRRSTGWTHNSYGVPSPTHHSTSSDSENRAWQELLDAQMQQPRDLVWQRRLERQYVDSAPTAHAREQRTIRLDERYRMEQHNYGCRGGVWQWYLGIGERTFDWVARKISRSHRFHREEPGVAYKSLVEDAGRRRPYAHYYVPGPQHGFPMPPRPFVGTAAPTTSTSTAE
ncbi:hypothetical protein LPJ70_002597 [Coemansia sp. RSA 2708]|nr:hypothetical protein LPJ70_002597 [Coemansia sp. RSA 2708]KAJ2304537.1 hypothetical protein IWW54_005371 [Coemansia sp. RSA 2705]KAJ2325161.1 hypothetical protein IWW51_002919 [Coemansia sp. RSA 2702]